ncbi:hypothetical protein [Amycolatopsis sp. NPDC059657]|uniref:hypothetical protein n=1 Tax=Amycolatopsis sp. NPDC059657 TaxID=3346899 RepID=UPI003670C630
MTSGRPTDEQFDEGLALLAEGAQAQAQRDFWRHYWPRRVVPLVVFVALLFSVGSASLTFTLYGRQDATDAAVASLRQQAQESKAAGDRANAELEQRGLAGVPIPAPGTAPDTEVIVSAAAARVLASLPDDVRPTSGMLGRAVADYIAENPVTPAAPTPQQISAALAGYFLTSPPPSGPTGEPGTPGEPGQPGTTGATGATGPQGPPPTAEQIQAAFSAYVQDHPDVLCPRGGTFAQLRVRLADGGAADTWQCVIATSPPPTSSSAPPILPIPTN